MKIIDTNVSLSRWPFRRLPCDEPEKLIDRLRRHGITQAWTGSLDGLFHRDVGGVNQRLADECGRHAPLLLPFGTVNPTLPDWEEDLRRCHEEHGMPGIRLHPNFHGYKIDDPRLARLLKLAEERSLLVQLFVRMDDTRVQHPLMQVPDVDVEPLVALLKATTDLRFMLAGALRVVRGEPLQRIIDTGQVHVEVSMLEGLGGVARLLETVPLGLVHFGSHLPLFNVESALLKLRESPLMPEQIDAITHKNSARLLAAG